MREQLNGRNVRVESKKRPRVPSLQLFRDRSNDPQPAESVQIHEIKNTKKITELVTDYRKENERFVDKVNKLQHKLKLENLRSKENSVVMSRQGDVDSCKPEHAYPRKSPRGAGGGGFGRRQMDSTTSYFTDEEEEYAVKDYGRNKGAKTFDSISDYEEARESVGAPGSPREY